MLDEYTRCNSTLEALQFHSTDKIITTANIPLLLSSRRALSSHYINTLQTNKEMSNEADVLNSEKLYYSDERSSALSAGAGQVSDLLWILNVINTHTKSELSIVCQSFESSEEINELGCTFTLPNKLTHNSHTEFQVHYIDGTLSFESWVGIVLFAPIRLASKYIEQIHYCKLLSVLPSASFPVFTNYELKWANQVLTKGVYEQVCNLNREKWHEITFCNYPLSINENTYRESDKYLSMINKVHRFPLRDALEFVIDVALFIDKERCLQAFVTSLVQEPFWPLLEKSRQNENDVNTAGNFLSSTFSKCIQTHYLGEFVHLIVNPKTLRLWREQIKTENERNNELIASSEHYTNKLNDNSNCKENTLSDKLLIFSSIELYFTFPYEVCKLLGLKHLNSAPQYDVKSCGEENHTIVEKLKKETEYDVNDNNYSYVLSENNSYCKWSELFRSQCALHYTHELVNQRRLSLARAERDRAVQKAILGSSKVITRSLRELYSTELKLIQTMEFTTNSLIRFTQTKIADVTHNHFNTIVKNINTYNSSENLRKQILTTLNLLTHIKVLAANDSDVHIIQAYNEAKQSMFLLQNTLNKCICECTCETAIMPEEHVERFTSNTSSVHWSSPSPSSSPTPSLTRKVAANLSISQVNARLKALQKALNEIHRCNKSLISFVSTLD